MCQALCWVPETGSVLWSARRMFSGHRWRAEAGRGQHILLWREGQRDIGSRGLHSVLTPEEKRSTCLFFSVILT